MNSRAKKIAELIHANNVLFGACGSGVPPTLEGLYLIVAEALKVGESRNVAMFDLDGSLANYVDALVRDMTELASLDDEPITADNLYTLEKQQHIRNRMRLIKRQPNWWLNLEPIEAGMKAMHIAKQIGFDIHVLTKGPKKAPLAWKEKLEWCQLHIDEDVDVHVTSDKGLVYGKVLYDDYPEYMDTWLKDRSRGLGIMPITSYNKDYTHPNVVRWDGTNVEELTTALTIAFNRQSGEELWLPVKK